MSLGVLLQNATEDELRTITKILKRANGKPAVVVTLREGRSTRRYVVCQEDESSFEDVDPAALAGGHWASGFYFGGQWLRGYGRVDEMYRSLSSSDVV